MRKILLASVSAVALFVLAACEGGESAPPEGGATTETTPEAPADTTQ